MADQNAQRDDNFVPSILGISSSNPNETAAAAVDPATNRLLVQATVTGAGSGGTSATDGDAYTAGTSAGTPVMGARDDAATATLAEDDLGVIRATENRALHVNLRDASGNEVSPGAGTQYEDGDIDATPTGNLVMVRDTGDDSVNAVSDTNPMPTSIESSVGLDNIEALLSAPLAVTQSGTWDEVGINDSGNSITVDQPTGSNLHVVADAGTSSIGKLLPPDTDVTAHTNYAKKYYTNAGAVTDGIVWSPAAGKRWHVVSLFINVSAAATVTLEDDKAGGDEAVMKMELAANSGTVINFSEMYPLASGEDAADLIVTTSAGNVYITATGYEV